MEQQIQTKKQHLDFDMSLFTAGDRDEMSKMYAQTFKNLEEGSIVPGKIIEIRGNEVLVDIGYKSEGTISGNEFSNISELKPGDELDVLLATIEDENGMVILSKEKADEQLQWENVVKTHEEGSVVEGIVKNRVRGGLIVGIGGVDAFLPGSQIDVIPVRNPDAYMGNTYEFKIIKISSERKNIILSRREHLEEKLKRTKRELLATIKVGERRKGKAKNITDFGVFIDLKGLDGLLHITDMSWGRIKHPSEIVNVGDEIDVLILGVDYERERVSLGLKQTMPNPWEKIDLRFPIGSRIQGRVVNLVPYGAFVELETGVEGLVHVSEISWTKRVTRASDILSPGQEVDVVVLNINKEEQKIALGIRQTQENPWDTVHNRYPVGSRVRGVVRNFTTYGAFLELEDGIDGMVHISDMSWTRKINHPSEVLTKAENVEAIVLEVDPENTRISLGIKQAQDVPWHSITERYKIGDSVKGKVTKLASFGAFVEIGEGIEGLVHISQISGDRVERIKDVLSVHKEIEAKIVRIDRDERRIGLSMKAMEMPEEEFEKQQEELKEGLKPGENMVDLAGAFDEAISLTSETEEWRPGESKMKNID